MSAIQRKDSVEYVSSILAELDSAMRELADHLRVVKETAERVVTLDDIVHKKQDELFTELKRMDLTSSGNHGFQQRLTRFLIDMRRTTIQRQEAS